MKKKCSDSTTRVMNVHGTASDHDGDDVNPWGPNERLSERSLRSALARRKRERTERFTKYGNRTKEAVTGDASANRIRKSANVA